MAMPRAVLPVLGLVFVQCAYGSFPLIVRIALNSGISPLAFTLYRAVLASGVLLGVAYCLEAREAAPRFWMQRDHLFAFALQGLLSIYFFQLIAATSLLNITPLNFSIAQPAIPLLTMVAMSLMGREAIDYKSLAGQMKLGGVLVTALGAVLAAALAPAGASAGRNPVMGNVYLAMECLGGALFPIVQKPLLAHYSPVTVAAWSHVCGAAITLIAALPVVTDLRWALDGPTALCLAYGVVVSSSLCLAIICWANGKTSPLVVTSFFPLQVRARTSMCVCGHMYISERTPRGVLADGHERAAERDAVRLRARRPRRRGHGVCRGWHRPRRGGLRGAGVLEKTRTATGRGIGVRRADVSTAVLCIIAWSP